MGQVPGSERTISGCMGQTYVVRVPGTAVITGSRAMPQRGHAPSPSWRTYLTERFFRRLERVGALPAADAALLAMLERFWRRHLAGPRGRVLLGEPGRRTGDEFPAWIVQQGWKIAFHEQFAPLRNRTIRLFELRGP